MLAEATTITTTVIEDPNLLDVLADCVAALQRVVGYRLPPALDRRLLWLSENKERLSPDEREELLAAIDFAEDRTLEKLHAQAVLKRLSTLFPHLVSSQS
jgi:hypothetical protein